MHLRNPVNWFPPGNGWISKRLTHRSWQSAIIFAQSVATHMSGSCTVRPLDGCPKIRPQNGAKYDESEFEPVSSSSTATRKPGNFSGRNKTEAKRGLL